MIIAAVSPKTLAALMLLVQKEIICKQKWSLCDLITNVKKMQ